MVALQKKGGGWNCAFIKKELSCLSLDPSDLIIRYCIIHQESNEQWLYLTM